MAQYINELRRQRVRLVSRRTRRITGSRVRVDTSFDVVPAHDFQEARVIGEAERLGGACDVPRVPLERRHDDLALGLGLERVKGGRRAFAAWTGPVSNLRGYVVETNRPGLRGDDHPLHRIAQLAHVVPLPTI